MEKLAYTVTELQKILNIGRSVAYQLTNRSDFPVVRIGRKVLIPADGLRRWLELQIEVKNHDL